MRCMERVTWKFTVPNVKYTANGNSLYDSGNSNRGSVTIFFFFLALTIRTFFLIYISIYLFILLYNIVLILPYNDMCSPS